MNVLTCTTPFTKNLRYAELATRHDYAGTQANYVQVTRLNSRFLLKNGYHRAYAALLAGLKYLPAVVFEASDFAETGALRPGFFGRELVMSAKPPLLKDFLDDRVMLDVKIRAMRKVIRIGIDEFFIPR